MDAVPDGLELSEGLTPVRSRIVSARRGSATYCTGIVEPPSHCPLRDTPCSIFRSVPPKDRHFAASHIRRYRANDYLVDIDAAGLLQRIADGPRNRIRGERLPPPADQRSGDIGIGDVVTQLGGDHAR